MKNTVLFLFTFFAFALYNPAIGQFENSILNVWGSVDPLQINPMFAGANEANTYGIFSSYGSYRIANQINTSYNSGWGSFRLGKDKNEGSRDASSFGIGTRISADITSLPSSGSFQLFSLAIPISYSFSMGKGHSRYRSPRLTLALQPSLMIFSQNMHDEMVGISIIDGYGNGISLNDPLFLSLMSSTFVEFAFGGGIYASNYSFGININNLSSLFGGGEIQNNSNALPTPIANFRLHGGRKMQSGFTFGGLVQFSELHNEGIFNIGWDTENPYDGIDNSWSIKIIFGGAQNKLTSGKASRIGGLVSYDLEEQGLSFYIGGNLKRSTITQSNGCIGISYNPKQKGYRPDNRAFIW